MTRHAPDYDQIIAGLRN